MPVEELDITADQKNDLVMSSLGFIKSLSEAYGTEKGQQVWNHISTVLDKNIIDSIFWTAFTGGASNKVVIGYCAPDCLFINAIKAVRVATSLGLKEAKDIMDSARAGTKTSVITFSAKHAKQLVAELRDAKVTANISIDAW